MNPCKCGCGELVAKTWKRGHSNVNRIENGTLYCKPCRVRKPLDDFYNSAKALSGKMGHCKACHEKRIAISAAKASTQTPEERKRKQRCSTIKSMYGITLAEFDAMVERQGGACLICEEIPNRRLDIDHCHKFGHVRGLLCGKCNKGLGHFRDEPKFLTAAIRYLQTTSPQGLTPGEPSSIVVPTATN